MQEGGHSVADETSQSAFGNVALFGLGSSTQAVAEYMLRAKPALASSVTIYTGSVEAASDARACALREAGAVVVEGDAVGQNHFDLGVVSPGIPETQQFYASAKRACDELVSEPELAWRESPRDWIAVTGTNGKTTTTTLAHDLLAASGLEARAVGNIGLPPIACVADRKPGEWFVAELSSFQLSSTRYFAPRSAILLNVTPDHVEWHGSFEAYANAKLRVFANMRAGDLCVLGSDDVCKTAASRLTAQGMRVIETGREPAPCLADAAWVDGQGRLTVRLNGSDHRLCGVDDLVLKGSHNIQNALAAAAVALDAGADTDAVAKALSCFAPLAHRIEPCGSVGGVTYIDDSKATNTDSAVKALSAVTPGACVILLGGHDKGTPLDDLANEVAATCRCAVCYGEAGERIARAVEDAVKACGRVPSCEVVRASGMRDAFEAAVEAACCGDTVLLSPACSSFDEFSGYDERGKVFKGLVDDLAARGA